MAKIPVASNKLTLLPLPPDQVLESAKAQCEYVLVLGRTASGELYAASSTSDMRDAVWTAGLFKHKVLSGDYDI